MSMTPEQFHDLQIYHALKLEVKHPGMRHSRGSVMNLARQKYGIQKRTKAGVLAEVEAILRERGLL